MLQILEPNPISTTKGNSKAYKFNVVIYANNFDDALDNLEDMLAEDQDGSLFDAEDVSE